MYIYIFISTLLLVAAFQDLKTREVNNIISLLILFVSIVFLSQTQHPLKNITTLFFAFPITFFFFIKGWWGGADTKIISALCLIFEPLEFVKFCWILSLTGGIQLLILLLYDRLMATENKFLTSNFQFPYVTTIFLSFMIYLLTE